MFISIAGLPQPLCGQKASKTAALSASESKQPSKKGPMDNFDRHYNFPGSLDTLNSLHPGLRILSRIFQESYGALP